MGEQEWTTTRRKRGRGQPSAWEERLQSAVDGERAAGAEQPRHQRRGTTLDEDRQRRQNRQASKGQRRYSEWVCDHCSTSNFLQTLDGKQATNCRRCKAFRLRDSTVLQGHGQEPETFAQKQQLPTKGNMIYEQSNKDAAAAASSGRMRDRPAEAQAARRRTPLQQAKLTLELAVAAGYPKEIVETMEAHLKELETQEKESRPLGQRYDQARKRLNQAKKANDDSLEALKDAR
jgi:ribosomal protein L40E